MKELKIAKNWPSQKEYSRVKKYIKRRKKLNGVNKRHE